MNPDSVLLECDHTTSFQCIDDSRQVFEQQRDLRLRPSLGATPDRMTEGPFNVRRARI